MFLCKTGLVIDGKCKCLKLSSWSWLSGQENMISIILQHFATYFEHLHRISHFGWIQAWLPVDLSTLHSQSVILHVSSCVVVSFYREPQNVHGGEGIIVEDWAPPHILHGDLQFQAAHISSSTFLI
ncbi:hypothetical protein NC652_025410 [Populus alba x Populus x berolinensis]|uniref:Uncharacterized protein n=1 Tax=Populus alba x Populus x berolinensis TaxID=444605 RepID=A0AAD6ME08_9ROSI|nr:hypothetical protein NC652_025410 [Populus alba x Populus x berolinensis]KAJ6983566.1 hypothetical protein NC653_026400 [Populus alba x Populus x berolinensis]